MTDNMLKRQLKNVLIMVSIGLVVSIIFNSYFIFNIFNDEEEFIITQFTEGNKTYKRVLKNYYDVEYEKTRTGIKIEINNPCIEIIKSRGKSMLPYWDLEELVIYDACFPKEKLEIGDVVIYNGEWDSTINPHHRIIDIDYEKEWIRTQGDNPETNPEPDDFVGFDRIIGKDIGVLNVLTDKKVVKEEVTNETIIGSVFFVSNLTLIDIRTKLCSTECVLWQYIDEQKNYNNDSFVIANNLTEENCKKCII